MDFQQIRDFVNPAVAQATGLQDVENLSMPVPVAYVPVQLVIDGALSLTSENPVQNKVIAVAIQNLDGRITAVEGQFAEGVTEAVNNWLAAHPEATTTVQDGAITYAKLDTNLKGKVDQISELKSTFVNNVLPLTNRLDRTLNAGWQTFDYIIKSGGKYIATFVSAEIDVYASADGTTNTYKINAGTEFIANTDTNYLRVWASDNSNTISIIEKDLTIEEIQEDISDLESSLQASTDELKSIDEFIERILLEKRLPDIWSRGTIDVNRGLIINYRQESRISTIIKTPVDLYIYFGNCQVYIANMETKATLASWKKGTFNIPAGASIGITVARTSSDESTVTTSELTNSIYVVNNIVYNKRYIKGLQSIARLGYDIDNPNTPPEMTTLSYQEAYIHGYSIMLADVVWTSDNVPVALHDTTINRVARNADGSTISEPIDPTQKSYAELDVYDYGIYKGEMYKGTKLQTIGRIALWCKMNACELYLEIRPNVVTQQMAKRLCDALGQYGMLDYCTFIVPSASTMQEIEAYSGLKMRTGIVLAQNFTDLQNKLLIDQITEMKTDGYDAFAYYYSLPMSADMITDTVYDYLLDNNVTAEFTEVRDSDYLTAFLSYAKTKIFNRVAVRPDPIHYQVLSLY